MYEVPGGEGLDGFLKVQDVSSPEYKIGLNVRETLCRICFWLKGLFLSYTKYIHILYTIILFINIYIFPQAYWLRGRNLHMMTRFELESARKNIKSLRYF
jgi:hypothetical protein